MSTQTKRPRGRPRGSVSPTRKAAALSVRFTEAERARLLELSTQEGITPSEYVRRAAIEREQTMKRTYSWNAHAIDGSDWATGTTNVLSDYSTPTKQALKDAGWALAGRAAGGLADATHYRVTVKDETGRTKGTWTLRAS